ncbi:MAG: response regulator [Sphingobacteriales bacterium]|nr:MAG: response regulator [Sphingobacteriales bacterium]
MKNAPRSSSVRTTGSKVILALLLACFALFLAWGVSKVAFNEMLETVESISEPSERLRMVNVISRKIGTLDQVQKNKAFSDPNNYRKLFKESVELRAALDTLGALYKTDSTQLARISTIKTLLSERDKQFINYLKVRERLVNNKPFSEQVKNLNDIMSKSIAHSDSTILATVEKTSTTTIYPEEKSRGFFSKLFGKKKPEPGNSFRIVSEEKVKRDTIALSREEQIAASLKKSLEIIEQQQQRKNATFLNREAMLAETNGSLVAEMRDVLRKVEGEVVNQIETNSVQAKKVMHTGITTISMIMLVFVVLMGVLLYLILTDITRSSRYRTELETARDEAEYHGRAKQRFLSNMSHEIRTPLQSIIGYSELLVNERGYNEHHVRAISQSSEHLLQIVNEVLDYNRIISGKFTFETRPFGMSELLHEVVSVMRPQAAAKALELVVDFDVNRLGLVEGDGFRLKQILLNLLGNAIKFTESGKITFSVEYKVRRNQAYFTFTVRDTGVGMSEADAKVVFNEFEQSKSIQREVSNQDGAGLGLTIVKALVENQNGRIYLKSKIGKGTVFTVFLAFNISEVVNKPENEEVLKVRLPSGSVWIIDDDPLILNLCEIIFRSVQIPFKSFRSPLDVLKEPINEDLSHILMDMRMPEMDGIELCGRLRDKISTDVEIIAMTAQVLPSEQGDILNKGFDALLMKPFKKQDLLDIVSDQLEINLDSLKTMTLDDPVLLANIIEGFCQDCTEDEGLVKAALQERDWEAVTLLIHRLAGRIGQIGISELSVTLRRIELKLRENDVSKESLEKDIINTLKHINIVVKMFESKRLSYSIS